MRRVLPILLLYCAAHGLWGHRCYAAGINESSGGNGFAAFLTEAATEASFLAGAAETPAERAQVIQHLRDKYGDEVLTAVFGMQLPAPRRDVARAARRR